MENKIDWVKIRNEIINEIKKDDEIFDTEGRLAFGGQNNQYKEIYWIRLNLKESNKLKDDYKGATAIHIMPYCITAEDVKKAEEKYIKGGEKCFYCRGPLFVDYDPDSGNFHKKIKYEDYKVDDIYPQIVLVYKDGKKPFGPGWRKKLIRPSGWFDFSWFEKENRLDAIKTHWYFPPIDEENKTMKYMEKIIQENSEKKSEIEKHIIALLEKVKEEIFK